MNTALWVVAIVTSLLFGFSGAYKVFATGKYREGAAWARSVAPRTVQMIGALEILGAIGIILPQWTGVLPWLTIVAGFCLALMQMTAMGLHIRRKEYSIVPINLILLALPLFVAVGRLWWD
jgi:uncharacterized membrane protein